MLTVDETAAFIWRLLETQGKHGCPWEKRILDWRDEEYAWRMSHPETIKDERKEETQEDERDQGSQGNES